MTLRPDRTTLAVVLVVALGALPLGLSSWWLAPVFLVPVAALVWVLRASVHADADAVAVCNGLGRRRVTWDDVAGFEVPKHGAVKLLRHSGKPLTLTAVNRRDLPRVLEAAPAPVEG